MGGLLCSRTKSDVNSAVQESEIKSNFSPNPYNEEPPLDPRNVLQEGCIFNSPNQMYEIAKNLPQHHYSSLRPQRTIHHLTQQGLAFASSVEQVSDTPLSPDSSSEEETTENLDRQNKDRICDPCVLGRSLKVMALYFCYVCGQSFCGECFRGHDESHGFLSLQSESEQLDREIDDFLVCMKNESDAERKKKFMKPDVCMRDYVDTECELDKDDDYFSTTGITGYGYKWWVVCDNHNHCIKVFSLRSNMLQRYIRFRSQPWDVTEINVENKTTEQHLASSSETGISKTDNNPNRKQLLAVTLPSENLIVIIDLIKTSAVISNEIKTEKQCYSIDSHEGNIYIVCEERPRDPPYSVSIMTVEGVTLKTFQTDVSGNDPYLTVLNGNIYMTDSHNDGVICYNDEGRVLHEIKIDGSQPVGICVDRTEDKVYVCSWRYGKVYELKADLSLYKSVLGQTKPFLKGPHAMCVYSDKLYVSEWSRSYVTVVRLL